MYCNPFKGSTNWLSFIESHVKNRPKVFSPNDCFRISKVELSPCTLKVDNFLPNVCFRILNIELLLCYRKLQVNAILESHFHTFCVNRPVNDLNDFRPVPIFLKAFFVDVILSYRTNIFAFKYEDIYYCQISRFYLK